MGKYINGGHEIKQGVYIQRKGLFDHSAYRFTGERNTSYEMEYINFKKKKTNGTVPVGLLQIFW